MSRLLFFGRNTLGETIPSNLALQLFQRDNLVICADKHPLLIHISDLLYSEQLEESPDRDCAFVINQEYEDKNIQQIYVGRFEGNLPPGWSRILANDLIKGEWINPETICGLWQPWPNVFLSTGKRAALEYDFRCVIQIQLADTYPIKSLLPTLRLCWRHDIPFRKQHVDIIVKFIETHGEPVLFHCDASNDRSPSMLAAYLFYKYGVDYKDGEKLISRVHPGNVESKDGNLIENLSRPWKLNVNYRQLKQTACNSVRYVLFSKQDTGYDRSIDWDPYCSMDPTVYPEGVFSPKVMYHT